MPNSSQETIISKFRPNDFNEVLGNELAVAALKAAVLGTARPHCYLFEGPSGTGKTTLARIIAKHIGALVEELDAASNSGVENMRQLVEGSSYQPIGASSKLVIIDEAHALSTKAWDPLLKLAEEPPNHLYLAFATTDPRKVPDAIKTRAFRVILKPLKITEMQDFVSIIAELEGWPLAPGILDGIVQAATGQPRKALSILQVGHLSRSLDELADVVAEVERENNALVELCQFLIKGGKSWGPISALLVKIEDDDDSIDMACRYLVKTITTGNEDTAKKAWKILDALTFPRSGWNKKAQLVAAVGSLVFGG